MILPPLLSLLLTAPDLTTHAERTRDVETGRYEEVERLCADFARAYPLRARCERFGTTPEGRPLLALILSQDGATTPAAIRRARRPVVLIQAGIHAGEIDGKDAGFRLLRDALDGKVLKGALARVTVVFIPVLNVDGHERFGPNHRPNQVGPAAMGWRASAQNLNLNRDYTKAEAPELQAVLRLMNAYDPEIALDLHVTDGAKFQPDVAVLVEPDRTGAEGLGALGRAYRAELFDGLRARGHQPLEFYPVFRREDAPETGFVYSWVPPRYTQGYLPLRNRLGVVVETHSWKPYRERVRTTVDVLELTLALAARDGRRWREAMDAADAADRDPSPANVVLSWRNGPREVPFDFPGYAYSLLPSPAFGRPVIRYDDTRPVTWRVPYAPDLEPALTVALPGAGWILPPAHAGWMAEKLALHGFASRRVPRTVQLDAEQFEATSVRVAPTTFEGRQRLELDGAWKAAGTQTIPAGSLYVPRAQPRRALLAQLLEPRAEDSFAAWGFFNAYFEDKEYLEDYVLEAFARERFERDADVRARFEVRLKDPRFAADPAARAAFFRALHPARDVRKDVYPVLRVDRAPVEEPAPARPRARRYSTWDGPW